MIAAPMIRPSSSPIEPESDESVLARTRSKAPSGPPLRNHQRATETAARVSVTVQPSSRHGAAGAADRLDPVVVERDEAPRAADHVGRGEAHGLRRVVEAEAPEEEHQTTASAQQPQRQRQAHDGREQAARRDLDRLGALFVAPTGVAEEEEGRDQAHAGDPQHGQHEEQTRRASPRSPAGPACRPAPGDR